MGRAIVMLGPSVSAELCLDDWGAADLENSLTKGLFHLAGRQIESTQTIAHTGHPCGQRVCSARDL